MSMTPDDQHRREIAEIRATLMETVEIQRQQAKTLRTLAERQAAFQEQLERVDHHLNVLIQVADGIIRDQVRPGAFAQYAGRVEDMDAKLQELLRKARGGK